MAVPTAPAAGEPIAEAWGDVVHDSIVAMDIQTGQATTPSASPASGELSGLVTITFPRPFAAPPTIAVMTNSAHYIVARGGAQTETQMTFQTKRPGSTNGSGTSFQWIAYGPRA